MGSCEKHWAEPAVAICRDCGGGACSVCLVQIARIGDLCTGCALIRAGVRYGSRRR